MKEKKKIINKQGWIPRNTMTNSHDVRVNPIPSVGVLYRCPQDGLMYNEPFDENITKIVKCKNCGKVLVKINNDGGYEIMDN